MAINLSRRQDGTAPHGSPVGIVIVSLLICASTLLLAVSLCILLIDTVNRSTIPFDTDEANHAVDGWEVYWAASNGSPQNLNEALTAQGFYPPLHSTAVALSYWLAGPSLASSRLPSVVIFALSLVLLAWLTYRISSRVVVDGTLRPWLPLIGAAFGVGFVLGPLIGGFLAEWGTRAPFYAAALLSGMNAVFGYFVLRETLPQGARRSFSWRRANPLGAFVQMRALPGVGALLLVFFLYQVAFTVYPSVWSFFGKERFGWEPSMIGLSLALFGIMMAIVQGGLIRPVIRLLGERGTVAFGHVFDIAAFVAIAFVASGTLALILVPIAALAAVITPALQGIMSKSVGPDQQGELQGALVSVGALATILSPMLMTATFARFTAADAPVYMPGAPFLLSALLIAAGLTVFSLFKPKPARGVAGGMN